MRILVLGGTLFLGRHVVDAALARGHDVTLFHRGKTGTELYPEVERVLGDRDGGLAPLSERSFDAVVDTSGYVPRIVDASASLLAPRCGHYVFVSSASVYREPLPVPLTEEHPVGTLDDPTVETVDGATYGPLKAACEAAARRHFPGRTTNVRAGLIAGPHDPTDRFTYWPRRLAEDGDVVCPPDDEQPVQLIDGRDLAAWIVHCCEHGVDGDLNAAGPGEPLTMGAMLRTIQEAVGGSGRLRPVPADVLARHEVAPWMGLPLWVPPEVNGMLSLDLARAHDAGLRHRPLAETARDTLTYARGLDRPWRAGISAETEAAVLADLASAP
jgi:2'-hydroxyisoflavone reductase